MKEDEPKISFWNKYILPVIIGGTSGILSGIITVTIAIMSFRNTVLNELKMTSIKLDERTRRIEKLEMDITTKADKATVVILGDMTTNNNAAIVGFYKDIEYLRKNSDIMLGKLDKIQENVK